MNELWISLQDSALIANVVSLVGLGMLGVVLRAIVRAVGEIGISKAEIDKTMSIYERFNLVERIVYLNSKLYKDAVVASSIEAPGKTQALQTFAEIEAAHKEYEDGIIANKEMMDNLAGKAEDFLETVYEDVKENMPSVLDQLKAQLDLEEKE